MANLRLKYPNFNLHFRLKFRVNANDKPVKKEVNYVVIDGWEKEDMITGFGIDMLIWIRQISVSIPFEYKAVSLGLTKVVSVMIKSYCFDFVQENLKKEMITS